MSEVATNANGAQQENHKDKVEHRLYRLPYPLDKPQGERTGKREDFKPNKGDRTEEHKGEREPREPFKYKPRHRGLAGEKIIVTLETVIPDLPKKNDIHPEPSDEAFQAELDKFQKDVDDCYKKMVPYITQTFSKTK